MRLCESQSRHAGRLLWQMERRVHPPRRWQGTAFIYHVRCSSTKPRLWWSIYYLRLYINQGLYYFKTANADLCLSQQLIGRNMNITELRVAPADVTWQRTNLNKERTCVTPQSTSIQTWALRIAFWQGPKKVVRKWTVKNKNRARWRQNTRGELLKWRKAVLSVSRKETDQTLLGSCSVSVIMLGGGGATPQTPCSNNDCVFLKHRGD